MDNSNFIRYPIESSIALRTNYILYPLSMGELMIALQKAQYNILPQVASSVSPYASLPGMQSLGAKGTNVVWMDVDNQIIKILGVTPDSISSTFSELEDIIKNIVSNLDEYRYFYETTSKYFIKTEKNPLITMGKISFSDKIIQNFENIFKQNIKLYGIRVCSETESANKPNWFNLLLEPVGPKSENTFIFESVFRNEDKHKVHIHLTNIEYQIDELIESLENYE